MEQTLVRAVPIFAFGLLAGTIADRVDRRRMILLIQSVWALTSLALGIVVATGRSSPKTSSTSDRTGSACSSALRAGALVGTGSPVVSGDVARKGRWMMLAGYGYAAAFALFAWVASFELAAIALGLIGLADLVGDNTQQHLPAAGGRGLSRRHGAFM